MEVLLRENYQWIKAKFDIKTGSITNENGNKIGQTNIVSIKNDSRSKYVVCKNCGEFICNTPKSIEEHFNKSSNSNACMTCRQMRVFRDAVPLVRKYELNNDGTYKETVKSKCVLKCTISGYGRDVDINSDDARSRCKYSRCRASGTKAIEDVFTRHPEVFDKIASVDALDANVWSLTECKTNGTFVYRVKKRFRLYAIVNSMGIIDHFRYEYYDSSYDFTYSAKYNKIFWTDGGTYSANNPGLSSSRVDEILSTIAKIYKE